MFTETVNFDEKLHVFKLWNDFDILQLYLCSWHNHPEDGHMCGRNVGDYRVTKLVQSYNHVHVLVFF